VLKLRLANPVVYGIARGGLVVAAEVAAALDCPLEVLAPRKIPSPYSAEVAIGAVTQDGSVYLDDRSAALHGVSASYLEDEVKAAKAEIGRRLRTYRGGRPEIDARGVDAVVSDDGIATGYTLLAAVGGLKRQNPRSVILAVPVAARDSLAKLSREVDRVICLETPEPFYAVGQAYLDFAQVSDQEVIELLKGGPGPRGSTPAH
jgi:predicted phosphoribosyltransferase